MGHGAGRGQEIEPGENSVAVRAAARVGRAAQGRVQLIKLGHKRIVEGEGARDGRADVGERRACAAPVDLLQRDDVRVEVVQEANDVGQLVAALYVPLGVSGWAG